VNDDQTPWMRLLRELFGDDAEAALEEHFALANAVGVTGTPAYIVGDTMLHGAIGADRIQQVIDNLRDCGQGTCS